MPSFNYENEMLNIVILVKLYVCLNLNKWEFKYMNGL